MLGDVDGDDTLGHVYLNGREADTRRRVHGLEHVVDEATHVVVHPRHRLRAIAQSRVRKMQNFTYGHRFSRRAPVLSMFAPGRPIIVLDASARAPREGRNRASPGPRERPVLFEFSELYSLYLSRVPN